MKIMNIFKKKEKILGVRELCNQRKLNSRVKVRY